MPAISDLVAPAPVAAAPAAPAGRPADALLSSPGAGKPASQPGFLQEPLAPTDESKAQIPDEVLKIPAFRALLQGNPPAVKVTQEEFQSDPTIAAIQGFAEPLLYSGFGFYQPKDGTSSVIYNSQFIDGNALKIADEKGKLDTVAAPYSELKTFFADNIGEAAATPPETAAPAAPASPASQPMGAPAPASSQTQLANARIKNLAVGSATSGPVPGGGRVLNNILKPTV